MPSGPIVVEDDEMGEQVDVELSPQVKSDSESDTISDIHGSNGFWRLHLWHIFTAQTLLMVGILSAVMAVLLLALVHRADDDVEKIFAVIMEEKAILLTQPLHAVELGVQRLSEEMNYNNFTADNFPSEPLSAMFPVFSLYVRTLSTLPYAAYTYNDATMPYWDSDNNAWFVDESACGRTYCYRVWNNTQRVFNLEPNDGWNPDNFTAANVAASANTSLSIVVSAEPYVEQAFSIQRNTSGASIWDSPLLWVENSDNITGQLVVKYYVLLSRYHCLQFNETNATSTPSPPCTSTIGVDVDLGTLTADLSRVDTAYPSTSTVVHLNSHRLMSTTIPELRIFDVANVVIDENTYGTASLTDQLFTVDNVPDERIRVAYAHFEKTCITSSTRVFIHTVPSYRLTWSCTQTSTRHDGYYIHTQLVVVNTDLQFLLFDMATLDALYGDVQSVLRITITIVVVLTVVVIGLIVLSMVSVTHSVGRLVSGFRAAAVLNYDTAATQDQHAAFEFHELQLLQNEFQRLLVQLRETRAFLPQSLVQDSQRKTSTVDPGGRKQPKTNSADLNDTFHEGLPSRGPVAKEPSHAEEGSARGIDFNAPPPYGGGGDESDAYLAASSSPDNVATAGGRSASSNPLSIRAGSAVVPQARAHATSRERVPAASINVEEPRSSVVLHLPDEHLPPTSSSGGREKTNVVSVTASHVPGSAAAAAALSMQRRTPQAGNIWPVVKQLNVGTALATRRVTILCVNAAGFHNVFQLRGALEGQRCHSALTDILLKSITDSGGVVDFFHGDHFQGSFNASRTCSSQGARCAQCVLDVRRLVNVTPHTIPLRMGVSTGTAVVGNLGNDKIRRFCVVGHVVNQAFALMLHCRAEATTDLIAPSSYDIMKEEYLLENRNMVALTMGSTKTRASIISTLIRKRQRPLAQSGTSAVSEVGIQEQVSSEELQIDELNHGFEALEKRDLVEAVRVVSSLPPELTVQLSKLVSLFRSSMSAAAAAPPPPAAASPPLSPATSQ